MDGFSYRIASELFDAHPAYCRGVLVFDQLDNRADGAALLPLLREAEQQVRDVVTANVAEHPRIAAWRDAYRRFGARPSEYRSSIEAMVRRVLQPAEIPSINPLVNIGNIVSLRHLLPAGVHPLGAGDQALQLRPARRPDVFAPADDKPSESPPDGEIVLVSDHEVLTRRWTWRQARGTQTLAETSRVFFNIDGLPPGSSDEVRAAMQDVRTLVQAHCGGTVVLSAVLHAAQPQMQTPA